MSPLVRMSLLNLESPSITINFNISPTSGVKIQQIRCILRETVSWKSPKEGGPAWSEKPRKYEFLAVDLGTQIMHSSDTIHLTKTTRLPNDYRASRSSLSTLPQMLTTEHDLLFEVEYTKNAHKFVGTLAKPVIIAGCELISESIRPPTYGSDPISDEELQPERVDDLVGGRNGYVYCTCGFNMDMLLQREMEGLSTETTSLLLPQPEQPAAQKSAAFVP